MPASAVWQTKQLARNSLAPFCTASCAAATPGSNSAPSATTMHDTPDFPAIRFSLLTLLGIPLPRRRCVGKGGNRHAGVVDFHDPRIGRQIELEHACRRDLGHQADIRHRGRSAMAERAAFLVLAEKTLHRLKAELQPMLNPGEFLRLGQLERVAEVIPDAHPLIVPRIRNYLSNTLKLSEAQKLAWIQHWLKLGLESMESLLGEHKESGTFCHGAAPTVADI